MTLEHRRMHRAFTTVEEAVAAAQFKAWKTAVMSFGSEVQRCGLLQAVAFLHRGQDKDVKAVAVRLTTCIRDHLIKVRILVPDEPESPLLTILRGVSTDEYMMATREVLALSLWLRRATQAQAGVDAPDDHHPADVN